MKMMRLLIKKTKEKLRILLIIITVLSVLALLLFAQAFLTYYLLKFIFD